MTQTFTENFNLNNKSLVGNKKHLLQNKNPVIEHLCSRKYVRSRKYFYAINALLYNIIVLV